MWTSVVNFVFCMSGVLLFLHHQDTVLLNLCPIRCSKNVQHCSVLPVSGYRWLLSQTLSLCRYFLAVSGSRWLWSQPSARLAWRRRRAASDGWWWWQPSLHSSLYAESHTALGCSMSSSRTSFTSLTLIRHGLDPFSSMSLLCPVSRKVE